LWKVPTAEQTEAELQEIALSWLLVPDGSGADMIVQVLPSHCTAKDFWIPTESK